MSRGKDHSKEHFMAQNTGGPRRLDILDSLSTRKVVIRHGHPGLAGRKSVVEPSCQES